MTLKPGSYIGSHTHKDNEDAYLIISGKGIFTDGNGHAWVVGAGDMTIARPGQTHGLANLGKEDLVFLDIIAKNDSADLSKMAKEGTTQYFPVSAQFEKNVEKKRAQVKERAFCSVVLLSVGKLRHRIRPSRRLAG